MGGNNIQMHGRHSSAAALFGGLENYTTVFSSSGRDDLELR